MKYFFTLALGIFVTIFSACNNDSQGQENRNGNKEMINGVKEKNKWSREEEENFLKEAYLNNLLIIDYSEIAWQEAETNALRDFANQTVPYYTNLNTQIVQKSISTDIGGEEYETEEDNPKDQESLENLTGKEVEVAYLKKLHKVLNSQAGLFEEASKNGSEENLRNWATKITSNLQSHLTAVEELQEEIK